MIKAKKSLGQNFLKSRSVVCSMVGASGVRAGGFVFEIGPGKGVLTAELLGRGVRVFAVEADIDLIPVLQERFEEEIKTGQLELVHGDVRDYYGEEANIFEKGYRIVANIPYYITGEIIREFLSCRNQPSSLTLLVQKEVAHRIVANDKKESILSLSVKAYGTPKYIEKVPAKLFSPAPKVDSAILHIGNVSKDFFKDIKEKDFFKVVKTGFAQKRKKLLNNLSVLKDKNAIKEVFKEFKLDENIRAEDVTLGAWEEIVKGIFL